MKKPFSYEQKMTVLYGILCFVVILLILQLWLLIATMDAYLGGDYKIALPAALVSLVCFGLNLGLLRYLSTMDGRS